MRTVGTELRAETRDYQAGMAGAAKTTKTLKDNITETVVAAKEADSALSGLDRSARASGRAAQAAGRDIHGFTSDLHRLDAAILETEAGLKSLAREFAKTNDAALLKNIRQAQNELRKLKNVRSLLGEPDAKSGHDYGKGLGRAIGSGLDSVSGVLGNHMGLTIAAGAGAAAVGPLAGALSAAVTAGAATGVIGLGAVLTAKGSPVFRARGAALGKSFVAGLTAQATGAFEGPLLESLDHLQGTLTRITGKMGAAFRSLAPEVLPLIDNLSRSVERVVDALATSARNAGPSLAALGDSLFLLSDGAGRFLEELSKGGPQAAADLRTIAGALGDIVAATGQTITWLSRMLDLGGGLPWKLLQKHYQGVADKGRDAASGAQAAATATRQLGAAATDAKKDLTPYEKAQQAAAEAAKGHRNALLDLSSALEAQFNPVQALINAQKDFKTKQDAAKEAVHKYGKNSKEARQASLDLAAAALNLTGKVGDLGGSFDGKLSPAMRTALRNAGLTKGQINDVEDAFKTAKSAGDKFAKKYEAKAGITGAAPVGAKLKILGEMQAALRQGDKPANYYGTLGKALSGKGYDKGGYTGPGAKMQVAGLVHADEFVVNKPSRRNLESARPGGLDYMNRTGRWPGYAAGGYVWPYPVTAAMTRIPSRGEAMAAVPLGAGAGYRAMEAMVRAAFPGMRVLSDFRPGARTLSGNVSYHALGRAVDYPPSRPLAEWINAKFKARTRELITPYQDLNILNGRRHTYTGAVWNQHNFAGGNAHDHWAMDGAGWMPSGGGGTPMAGGGGGGNTYYVLNASLGGPIGSRAELDNWLTASFDRLRRGART